MSAPKLSPEAQRRRYDYNNGYRSKNFRSKCIAFNRQFPEDVALLDWINEQVKYGENGNQYIKRLVREDMERRQKEEADQKKLNV